MGKRNPIVHIEWRSRQTGRLKDFYRQVFGWKFEEAMPGYLMAATGTKDVSAGFMQIEASSTLQPGIVSFLEAEDLGGIEAAIREGGGQVVTSSQAIPGMGRFSLFTDPEGNPLGLWQSEAAVKREEKAAKKSEKKRQKAAAKAAAPDAKPEKAVKKQKLETKSDERDSQKDKKKGQKDKKKNKNKKKDKKNKQGQAPVA